VRREVRGRGVSIYFLVFPAVSVISPLVGGYVAEVFGYRALFGAALSLTATNAALIALLSGRLPHPSFPPPTTISPLSSPLGVAFLFNGFMDGMFWVAIPLLLFEMAGSEAGLGYCPSTGLPRGWRWSPWVLSGWTYGDERAMLEEEARWLEARLKYVKKRLEELGGGE